MKTHILSDETGQRIAVALESMATSNVLKYDDETGYYTNASIAAMLASRRDGLAYGVSIPKGNAFACTKIGANAGIAVPTPGIVGRPAIDPYRGLGPFFRLTVNGEVDADGMPHVTAVEGDGKFALDGSNGNVWILAPVLYWKMDESGADAVTISMSDTKLSGMAPQPQAYLPDGTLRPYILYAKYPGSNDGSGMMQSVSGAITWSGNVSHNSLIAQCKTATTGYSGKSIADDWYTKIMFFVKYATKRSQSVFAGCTSYNLNYAITVAESGVTRAIIAKTNAANLLVGSTVAIGTSDKGTQIIGNRRILRIEDYDTDNSAVYLDTSTTFTTTVGDKLCTMPWHSGSCDMVEGDGSPTNPTSGKEPFVLQGIECMVGCCEVLGDVIIASDGSTGWIPYICYDSKNESTSRTSNYASCGTSLPVDSTDSWKYPLYPKNGKGLLFGISTGGSQTTGMCDGTYTNKTETAGEREWLGLGHLNGGGYAGLWCVTAVYGLSNAWWGIGSRLSGTGRSKAV